MENNKNLVPAGYSCDWWASDLIDALGTQDDVEAFATICKGLDPHPDGVPGATNIEDENAQFHVRRRWHRYLSNRPQLGIRRQPLQNDGGLRLHLHTTHGSSTYQSNGFPPS